MLHHNAPLPHPIVVVAPNIRSAYNVGSIFRTADSAGLAHIYLCGWTATPEHRGVKKTALGAEDTVSWSQHDDPQVLLDQLRQMGYVVAALERTDTSVPPTAVGLAQFPLALVLGNEVDGVAPEILSRTDFHIALAQYGSKTSLNVAVACGVACYSLVERYRDLAGYP